MTVYMRPGQSVAGFMRDLPVADEKAKKPRAGRTVPQYDRPVHITRLELLAAAFIAMSLSTAIIYAVKQTPPPFEDGVVTPPARGG